MVYLPFDRLMTRYGEHVEPCGENHIHGFVLLVVLGILALMSVLALAFVSVTRLEKQLAINYVNHIKAQLAAESGIEAAMNAIHHATAEGLLTLLDEGLKGAIGSSYVFGGDTYTVTITDESGKFNINDSPAVPASDRMFGIVERLTNNLFPGRPFHEQ